MFPKKFQKSSKNYCCIICDYNTRRSSQYERHLLTRKHSILTQTHNLDKKSSDLIFACECGKNYKYRQSLYTHKKNCTFLTPTNLKDISFNSINSNILNLSNV